MYFLQVDDGFNVPKVLGGYSTFGSAVKRAENHARQHYPGLTVEFEQRGEILWLAQQQGIIYQIRLGDP